MKLSALLPGFVLFPFSAQANPACVVCTVAVGASLEIARRLGINDNVVGLWAGAMLAVLATGRSPGLKRKTGVLPAAIFG